MEHGDSVICCYKMELLLDKLDSLALPFLEKKNMAELKYYLKKFQEPGIGVEHCLFLQNSDHWVETFEEAVYEAEDALDEYLTEKLVMETQPQPPYIKKLQHFIQRKVRGRLSSGLAQSKLKRITESLESMLRDVAGKMHGSCPEMAPILTETAQESAEQNQIQLFPDESELVEQIYGRGAEKEEIVQLLINRNEKDVLVIPIVGQQGIGKTTVAHLVFNDERVQNHFELKLWIDMHNTSDVRRTIEKVIQGTAGGSGNISEDDELQRCVRGALSGTLFLLVLDDLGDGNCVDGLLAFLSCVGSGSRIVATTRSPQVSSSGSTTQPFRLGGLSEEDSWSLFSQGAFGNPRQKNYKKFASVGQDIVKMCRGIPLFVKMLRGLLYFQRKEIEWELVREGMIQKPDNHLRLCFGHLNTHLKHCFAFCCVFPKGYEIEKETLIQLWMANGLVPSKQGMELEDVGREIFNELVVRSFFQDIQQRFANITTFKLHDLLHDLLHDDAQRVMGIEPRYFSHSKVFYFVYHPSLELLSRPLLLKAIRRCLATSSTAKTLRIFCLLPLHLGLHHLHSEVSALYDNVTTLKVLRVLDLRGWKRSSLPTRIGNLKHLRYLDLSHTIVVNLPASMSNLVNLQTLKLCECRSLRQLPQGMKYMINLRYLDTWGCDMLTHMPPKIGQLHCLQVLSLFIVGSKTGSCSGIEELQCLNLRGRLQIRRLDHVKNPTDAQQANLLGKPNLGELHLCWRDCNEGEEEINDNGVTLGVNTEAEVLEALQPHQKLEKLWITDYMGVRFPGWLGSHLENLVEIRLYGCRRCEYLPPLGQLPLLKILRIKNLDAVEYIGGEFYGSNLSEGFPSLETLKIKNMSNLEAWLESQGKRAFLRLSKLKVAFCDRLTTMPCFPSIKHLLLDETDSMLLSSVADCTSLSSLTIRGCSGLMSLPEELLQNLMSLKSLTISHCENLAYLPIELQNLTSLEHFTLSHCAKLESLPEKGIQGLASLKELKIEYCENLRTLSEGLQYLTTLQMLHVNWCDKLEYLPDGLQYLINLKHLRLFYCQGLKILPEEIGNLSSLEVLTFGSAKLTSLPEAIGNLSSLRVLMIGSLGLTSLPEGLQQLTTLRELFIGNCHQLVSLPEWLENLTSLNSLWITGCPNVTSLPAGLRCLTSLRRLLIRDCPKLKARCRVTGEDWHKIQHIPNIIIE